MNRILLISDEIQAGGRVLLSDERANHIFKVLRAKPGQRIRVGVLNGRMGQAVVESMQNGVVQMQCVFADTAPHRPSVDLLLAMPRPKVMKRLWAQLAALGVGHVFITNAEKVERNYFDTHILGEDFVFKQLLEGLQQCGDTCMPTFSVHRRLKVLLEDELVGHCEPDTCRIIAHPYGGMAVRDALKGGSGTRVLLSVGPEGGWNEYELNLFDQQQFRPVSLGSRILRSDTACISLLTLVHDVLDSCSERNDRHSP